MDAGAACAAQGRALAVRAALLPLALGEPMDSSTTPAAVAFYQGQFEQKPEAQAPGPWGARSSKRIAAEFPESLRLQARRE